MSSGVLRKYAPDDIAMTVGTQTVTGVKEGTFVECERTAETGSLDIGSDGEATLIISPNESGTIKFTLQQSSPLNDYFNMLFQALQQKNTSIAVVPISIEDKNGTTVVSSKQSVPQKPAKVTFADKAEGREWTFICPYLDMELGGESSV
jgi:hypothetical protein